MRTVWRMREFGAGFQVLEQGASNLGTALAGSTVNANSDASSAFWNPSASFSMDLREGDTVIDSGMNFVIPSFSFTGKSYAMGREVSGSNGGNAGEISYVPNFYLVHQFTEKLAGTLSITSPYGLETDYDGDWVGRYQALNSDLITVDINPSVAYKVNDWLSVGGGVSLQYMARRAYTGNAYRPRNGRYRRPARAELGRGRQLRLHGSIRRGRAHRL